MWQDPPGYWDSIIWPAYVRAHEKMFQRGDVENGAPNGLVPDLFVLEGGKESMTSLFERTCEEIMAKCGQITSTA